MKLKTKKNNNNTEKQQHNISQKLIHSQARQYSEYTRETIKSIKIQFTSTLIYTESIFNMIHIVRSGKNINPPELHWQTILLESITDIRQGKKMAVG